MRDLKLFLGLCSAFALLAIWGDYKAYADHESTVARDSGSYLDVRVVSIASNTGTALWPATLKRPDSVCRNNGAAIIYIGTVTATVSGAYHTNIIQGFPVLSSETIKLDGKMTGIGCATCDVGVSACEMRCLDGLNR